MKRCLLASALIWAFFSSTMEAGLKMKRTEDVIYGRKFGMALTMDVFAPAQPNGAGIVWIVSGGWFSAKEAIQPDNPLISTFVERGYTVFAVLHGSQPKFTIPEIADDVHRAIRFIRQNAAHYAINPYQLGVTGGSAGGHLALTLATQGAPGNQESTDPTDRESSAVQAVACFFPPTDFLNYGQPGEDAVGVGILADFQAAFGPRSTDPAERPKLGREISPIYFVTQNLPPTLIIHGDADALVPVQQAETFVRRATETGATAKLIVREGEGHGWADFQPDLEIFANWFEEHLFEGR